MRKNFEICDDCGRPRPLPVKVAVSPLRKDVRERYNGGVLTIDRHAIVVAGSGQQLLQHLHAEFVREFASILHPGSYYGWTRGYGPVKIDVSNGKALQAILGDDFVRARVGLVVRLDACLVLERKERQIGLDAGLENGRPRIFRVDCSRRDELLLRERLLGAHHCVARGVAAESDFDGGTTENPEMA